ncbi:MAG: hypothetical protein U0939_05115 [Pirellulales bacterium]
MTLTENAHDRLSELYRELNQGHTVRRKSLLQQLPDMTADVPRATDDTNSERRLARRMLIGGAMAASAAMLIPGLFMVRPRAAWADVAKAVRAQKWIHCVTKGFDGSITEVWESPSTEISVWKSSSEIRLVDKGTSLMQVFHRKQNKIVRLELGDQEPVDSMQLFINVLLGDAEQLRHLNVIVRQQRSITDHGQTWDEIRLTAQPIGGSPMTWIAKIDPQTHLPHSVRIELQDAPEAGHKQRELEFDYPSDGPTTLAALGVPVDVAVEDRVPKDSLKSILADMRMQRRNLGAYHLKLFYADSPRLSRESWKDGLKWRQDHESPDVCDGREEWSKHMGSWQRIKKIPDSPREEFCRLNPQWYYLENMSYPFLSATPEFDLAVRPDRTDGPEGCILVERVANPGANPSVVHRFTAHREQYWLDPRRGHALVKRVLTDVEAPEAECLSKGIAKHIETTFSDFQQSPHGVWYPTTITTTGTLWVRQTNPLIVEPKEQRWKVAVEFHDAFPDHVFNITDARKRSP